jgi:Domain of unknown function (DUF4294)
MKNTFFKIILIALVFILNKNNISAQQIFPTYKVVNGDTLKEVQLNEATVVATMYFNNDTTRYRYNQMKYYMKIVLPYAKQAVTLFNELDSITNTMSGGTKRKYIKSREKEIKSQVEDKLKSLNITQGKYLVKMINRNAKRTCFDIIKYLHNPIKATAYQAWARLNGIDLNENYNPDNNRDFERIMKVIDK